MNRPRYIVLHTAAHGSGDKDYDTTAKEIDRWHKENGWKGIGYHYVIRKSGEIEKGREETESGAHCRGLNSDSIGICFSGHGDIAMLTQGQIDSALKLIDTLINKYNIPIKNIIGHREADKLPGVPAVNKTCPGKLVDMNAFRKIIGCRKFLQKIAFRRDK